MAERYKISRNFYLDELMHPYPLSVLKNKAEWLLDPKLVHAVQFIRDYFGKIVIINNHYHGGSLENRGFRPCNSTVGGKFSQHRFGRAADLTVKGYDAEELRQVIKDNQPLFSDNHINAVENKVNWLHIDCRNTGLDGAVMFFNP